MDARTTQAELPCSYRGPQGAPTHPWPSPEQPHAPQPGTKRVGRRVSGLQGSSSAVCDSSSRKIQWDPGGRSLHPGAQLGQEHPNFQDFNPGNRHGGSYALGGSRRRWKAEQCEGHPHSSAPFHTGCKWNSQGSPPQPSHTVLYSRPGLTRFWMSALLARSRSSIIFFSALTASLSSSFCHCGITAVASICKTGVGGEG